MNLNDFKYIVTIAELGSFNAAAKELYVTQPSLSQRVKYIENEYGITIFTRDRLGVALTAEGKEFMQYASRILECESELRKNFQKTPDRDVQTIRFGISWTANTLFFQEMIPALVKAYPDKYFEFMELSSPDQQEALLSDKIDLSLCYLPIASPDLTYRIIMTDTIVVVPRKGGAMGRKLSANAAPKTYINPRYLNGEPISIGFKGSYLRAYIQSIIETEEIRPEIRHSLKSLPLMYAMVERGLSTGVMFESFFLGRSGMLPYYYLDSQVNNSMPIALAWRKGAKFSAFADDLAHVIRRYNAAQLSPG